MLQPTSLRTMCMVDLANINRRSLAFVLARGQTQTRAMDKRKNRHLHMQELGLQGLYKQLLSHSLCQGVCNHL